MISNVMSSRSNYVVLRIIKSWTAFALWKRGFRVIFMITLSRWKGMFSSVSKLCVAMYESIEILKNYKFEKKIEILKNFKIIFFFSNF